MNKALLFSLALALLASCSSEPTTSSAPASNDSTDSNISTPDTAETSDTTEEVAEDQNQEDVSEEVQDVEVEITAEEGEDSLDSFVLPVCDNPINNSFAEAIAGARNEEENLYNPIVIDEESEFSDIIFPMLAFEPEIAQGYAISVSAMMVQAYGIAAILPVEGQEAAVEAGMQQFIDTQIQNFTGYLPDQLEVAQAARLETLPDGTLLMVMSENQDALFESIAAQLS